MVGEEVELLEDDAAASPFAISPWCIQAQADRLAAKAIITAAVTSLRMFGTPVGERFRRFGEPQCARRSKEALP